MAPLFVYAGLAISFFNGLFYAIIEDLRAVYPSIAFWIVESAGITLLVVGGYLIHSEVKKEEAEDKAKAEARERKINSEGITETGIVEDLRQYATSSFSVSIGIIVKIMPSGSQPLSIEVYVGGVKNIYIPQFQPGTKVEIRYVPSDPSINEFIGIVGQTKDYREDAEA